MGKWNFHLLPVLGIAVHPIVTIYENWGNPVRIMSGISAGYTGYDTTTGEWRTDLMLRAWGPIILGTIGSWFAGKIGLNRKLPKGFNL